MTCQKIFSSKTQGGYVDLTIPEWFNPKKEPQGGTSYWSLTGFCMVSFSHHYTGLTISINNCIDMFSSLVELIHELFLSNGNFHLRWWLNFIITKHEIDQQSHPISQIWKAIFDYWISFVCINWSGSCHCQQEKRIKSTHNILIKKVLNTTGLEEENNNLIPYMTTPIRSDY